MVDPIFRVFENQGKEGKTLTISIHSSEDVEGIVGEEPLLVEDGGEHLGGGGAGHLLVVLVPVELHSHLEVLVEGHNVAIEPTGGQHRVLISTMIQRLY